MKCGEVDDAPMPFWKGLQSCHGAANLSASIALSGSRATNAISLLYTPIQVPSVDYLVN